MVAETLLKLLQREARETVEEVSSAKRSRQIPPKKNFTCIGRCTLNCLEKRCRGACDNMVEYSNALEIAKNNYQTGIGKTYTSSDVEEVWKQVAQFIRSSLLKKRAVDIKGLGRFTIQEYSMPVSSIYAIWSHRPVFYLDKRLCDSYHIKCVRLYSSDKISVVTPNLTTIAALTKLSRHAVEDSINEVVQALCRLCMEQRDLELPLPSLGVLRIVNRYTDMRYSRELVRAVHQDITDPLLMASHVRDCARRPVPRPSFLAPVAVPPPYLRDMHAVNYG